MGTIMMALQGIGEYARRDLLSFVGVKKEYGKSGRIICTHEGTITDVDIDEGLSMKKSIQQNEVDVFQAMTGI